jgi:hypothetical protein
MPVLHFPQNSGTSHLAELRDLYLFRSLALANRSNTSQLLYCADAYVRRVTDPNWPTGGVEVSAEDRNILGRLARSHFFMLDEVLPTLRKLDAVYARNEWNDRRILHYWFSPPSRPNMYGVESADPQQIGAALATYFGLDPHEVASLGAGVMTGIIERFVSNSSNVDEQLSPALLTRVETLRNAISEGTTDSLSVSDIAPLLSIDAAYSIGSETFAASVDVLQLNTRARNVLCDVAIYTLGQLVQWSECELLIVRYCGPRTMIEVGEALAGRGLQLRDEVMYNESTSIEAFGLNTRARNALLNGGITTIGQLVQKTEAELLKLKGFGVVSLSDVKAALHERGLELGVTIED